MLRFQKLFYRVGWRSFRDHSANPQRRRKKAFDRGGPVWPPRSNAADDRSRGWSQSPPRPHPLNGRSSHLIEAAKRGRLDQMIFFSAPLTTRAPPTTVRRPSDDRPPAVRQPSTVPMILRYLGANLRAGANFKNLPLQICQLQN